MGQFFDNEFFVGKSISKQYDFLDFDWGGTEPIEGVNASDFSAIFNGLIMAPLSDDYVFHVRCDGGFELKINDALVLDHFMSNPFVGYKNAAWGEEIRSEKINLNSGMLYKFEIKYWRSPSHEF